MDFDKIFSDVIETMFEVIKNDAPKYKDQLTQILEDNKERFERITNKLLSGKISKDEYAMLLSRNMRLVQDQLSTIQLLKTKTIQDAINAGINVLTKAVAVS